MSELTDDDFMDKYGQKENKSRVTIGGSRFSENTEHQYLPKKTFVVYAGGDRHTAEQKAISLYLKELKKDLVMIEFQNIDGD